MLKKVNRMKNQKYKLSGKNIYRDARGRAIYYVPKEKRAYQIKENQEGLFQTLQLRYYLVFVIGLLIYFTIVPNLLISIFVPFILFIFLEYEYRSVLKNSVQIENYNMKKNHTKKYDFDEKDIEEKNSSLIVKMIFFIVIGILLIINSFISKDIASSRIAIFGTYLAALISFYFSYRVFKMYYYKNHL